MSTIEGSSKVNEKATGRSRIVVSGITSHSNKNINLHVGKFGLGSFFVFSFFLSLLCFFVGINIGSSGAYSLWIDQSLSCSEDNDSKNSSQVNCFVKKTLLKVDASGEDGVSLSDFKAFMEDNTATIDHLYQVYDDLKGIKMLREQIADCQKTSSESLMYLKSILEISELNCSTNVNPSKSIK